MKIMIILVLAAAFVAFSTIVLFKVVNGTDPKKSGLQKQLDDEQMHIIAEMVKKKE